MTSKREDGHSLSRGHGLRLPQHYHLKMKQVYGCWSTYPDSEPLYPNPFLLHQVSLVFQILHDVPSGVIYGVQIKIHGRNVSDRHVNFT